MVDTKLFGRLMLHLPRLNGQFQLGLPANSMSGRFSLPDILGALPKELFGRKAILLINVKLFPAKISKVEKVFVISE